MSRETDEQSTAFFIEAGDRRLAGLDGDISAVCNYDLLSITEKIAAGKELPLKIGSLYSSDTFYDDTHSSLGWAKMGCLAVEMEAAGSAVLTDDMIGDGDEITVVM